MKFGASQGRLVATRNGELQSFPQSNWQEEFKIAGQLGLGFIELLVERKLNNLNPIWSIEGRGAIKEAAQKNGIDLYSCCFDYVIEHDIRKQDDFFNFQASNFFEACNDLSISMVVLPLLEKSNLTQNNYESYAPIIKAFADEHLVEGVQLCIECLLPAAELNEFLDLVNHPNVSCVYDTGNRVIFGIDLAAEILLLNTKIKHFHVKDKNISGDNVILGTGLVNFEQVFEALRQIDYRGYFNFETTRGKNPDITMSYHYDLSTFFLEEAHREDT